MARGGDECDTVGDTQHRIAHIGFFAVRLPREAPSTDAAFVSNSR